MFERNRRGAVDLITGDEAMIVDQLDKLSSLLDECLETGQPRVVLDMQLVPLVDSTGLEWLLAAQQRCESRGGALKIAAPTSLCSEILAVTGVGGRFEVHDDSGTAVGSFT